MKLVGLTNNKRINNLAQKIASGIFNDVNTAVGILISKTHDRIGFPIDRSRQSSTSAVTIPRDCYKEHIALFSDTAEIKAVVDEEWEHIILLGKEVLDKTEAEQTNIITHEMQHVKQNHLEPIVLAKDRLLDIVWDLSGEKSLNTPSELNAKARERDQESSMELWVNETNYKFEQQRDLVGNIHGIINHYPSTTQKLIVVPPEVADLFEFYYKKVFN